MCEKSYEPVNAVELVAGDKIILLELMHYVIITSIVLRPHCMDIHYTGTEKGVRWVKKDTLVLRIRE